MLRRHAGVAAVFAATLVVAFAPVGPGTSAAPSMVAMADTAPPMGLTITVTMDYFERFDVPGLEELPQIPRQMRRGEQVER
jgi:hypothetical protein